MWQPMLNEGEVLEALQKEFGGIEDRSGSFDFSQTDYYAREMGAGLRKIFVAIEGQRLRDSLVELKHKATELEDRYLSSEGGRKLNVDPMIVSLENVVVASSKNFPHRIYLGDGVYGDLQLLRRKGGFEAFAWTYPDYVENSDFFERQHRYLRQSRSGSLE